jgi:hypothetical protein
MPVGLPCLRGSSSFSAAARPRASQLSRGGMASYKYARVPAPGRRTRLSVAALEGHPSEFALSIRRPLSSRLVGRIIRGVPA